MGGIQIHFSGYLCTMGFNVDHAGGRSFITNSHCTSRQGGTEGTVQSINLMHTLLILPDNREAILPNAKIGSDVIVNFNRLGTRRFELKLGIGHRDDADQVMGAIMRLLEADDRVLKDPAPGVWIESLAGQTVNLVLRGWTRSADGWAVQTDLLRAIKQQIDAGQISIPVMPMDIRWSAEPSPSPVSGQG